MNTAGEEDTTDAGVPKAKGLEEAGAIDGFPPTFTEKPKIVPNETGTLVTMRFRVRSKPKAEMQWYKGNQKIQEGQKFKTKYIDLGNDEYEVVLEISVSIYVRQNLTQANLILPKFGKSFITHLAAN